jgi:hypothetical protein
MCVLVWLADVGRGASEGLRVRLVDGVTGAVLAERAHAGAHGPVAAAVAEHWAVYSFVGAGEQPEVVVMELYEAATPDTRDASPSFSSYRAARPAVLAQAYAAPFLPRALAVTQTRHGITSRQVVGPCTYQGRAHCHSHATRM